MLVHWVWLAHRPGLSDWLRWQILQQYGDPEAVYYASDYRRIEDLTEEGLKGLLDKDLRDAETILEHCLEERISILTIQDALYCSRLKNIPDPPLVLYYRGRLQDLDSTAVIGVVGTRAASLYGLGCARTLSREIGSSGGIVVSGMAKGIDAMAMEGALSGDGTVIGVLGCGVDIVYPRSNRTLFENTERYGCIFSEFPPGTPPLPGNFPKRNRIISGLSSGVLVVEAPMKSGALITARLAADQGRDVFVVPGNIGVPTCAGSNSLLRDGAIAVTCGWDVLSEYEYRYEGRLKERKLPPERTEEPPASPPSEPEKPEPQGPAPSAQPSENQAGTINSREKVIDNPASEPYIDLNDILSKCTEPQQAILKALQQGRCIVDDLVAGTGISTQEVLSCLTILEIRGFIERHPGRQVSLKKATAKRSKMNG